MVRMFDASVVGYAPTKFTNQQTGEVISGYNVYFSFEGSDVTGVSCGRLYLSPSAFKTQAIGLDARITVAYIKGKYELVV